MVSLCRRPRGCCPELTKIEDVYFMSDDHGNKLKLSESDVLNIIDSLKRAKEQVDSQ